MSKIRGEGRVYFKLEVRDKDNNLVDIIEDVIDGKLVIEDRRNAGNDNRGVPLKDGALEILVLEDTNGNEKD